MPDSQLCQYIEDLLNISSRAASGKPVGRKELLVAFSALDPELVVEGSKRQGLNPRCLAWALNEWLPDTTSSVELGSAIGKLDGDARTLLSRLLRSQPEPAAFKEDLLRELLATNGSASRENARSEPPSSLTQQLLQALRLV